MQLVVTAAVVWIHWRWYSVHLATTSSADASGNAAILYKGNIRWSCLSTQPCCCSRRSESNYRVLFYFYLYYCYHHLYII